VPLIAAGLVTVIEAGARVAGWNLLAARARGWKRSPSFPALAF
jgi:hypothetical protein